MLHPLSSARSYTVTFTNSRFICDQQIPFSAIQDQCPEVIARPDQFPSPSCMAASMAGLNSALCARPQCINYCREGCR